MITGVQGSGKTFIAKSLFSGLQNHGMNMNGIWICNLDQLHQTPGRKEDVFNLNHYVIDFYPYEF